MKSMTGFGRAIVDCPDFALTVDISSVNKKGLELNVALPRDWQAMERLVAQKIKKNFARGKVNVACRVDFKKSASSFSIDEAAVQDSLSKLRDCCQKLGVPFAPTTEIVLKLNDKPSNSAESAADWEESWGAVESTIDAAIVKIDEMRDAEGESLKKDLSDRLNLIEKMVATVESTSVGTVERYRELLLQKLKNSGLEIDLNDERVLKEICLFADKSDICEETTRLKSHIAQFATTMNENDAVGRKMDFICQEMGREINTIASKANNLDLTKLAIEMKNELERIREQTQNVE